MFAAMRHQEFSPLAICGRLSQFLNTCGTCAFLVGVGVRSGMQLAMNASPAPRGRRGSVALPSCS